MKGGSLHVDYVHMFPILRFLVKSATRSLFRSSRGRIGEGAGPTLLVASAECRVFIVDINSTSSLRPHILPTHPFHPHSFATTTML